MDLTSDDFYIGDYPNNIVILQVLIIIFREKEEE